MEIWNSVSQSNTDTHSTQPLSISSPELVVPNTESKPIDPSIEEASNLFDQLVSDSQSSHPDVFSSTALDNTLFSSLGTEKASQSSTIQSNHDASIINSDPFDQALSSDFDPVQTAEDLFSVPSDDMSLFNE